MSKVIVINSDKFGIGNDELGEKLMGAFLRKLWANELKPGEIILYNSGVKLITKRSTVLDAMDGLYSAGVDILACGTCLDFFDLTKEIKVGRISDMEEITSIILKAESVINL